MIGKLRYARLSPAAKLVIKTEKARLKRERDLIQTQEAISVCILFLKLGEIELAAGYLLYKLPMIDEVLE